MTHNTTNPLDQRRASIGRHGVITFAACLTVVGLAACGSAGGGDDPATQSPAADTAATPPESPEPPESPLDADGAVDVCALITPADLSAAFGRTFDAGTLTHHDEIGGDQCIWNVADPNSVGMVSLTVQRDSDLPDELHDNGINVQQMFDEARRSIYTDGVDFLLGDAAYTSGSTVHVLYDDAMFDFMTLGNTPEDIAALQSLATATIEALTA
jgi:Protein of unknown function (DUF3558)